MAVGSSGCAPFYAEPAKKTREPVHRSSREVACLARGPAPEGGVRGAAGENVPGSSGAGRVWRIHLRTICHRPRPSVVARRRSNPARCPAPTAPAPLRRGRHLAASWRPVSVIGSCDRMIGRRRTAVGCGGDSLCRAGTATGGRRAGRRCRGGAPQAEHPAAPPAGPRAGAGEPVYGLKDVISRGRTRRGAS